MEYQLLNTLYFLPKAPVWGQSWQKSPKANRAELFCSAAAYAHDQVRTAKQHVKPVHVLGNSAICCFAVSELPFHDQKRMLHFTPNRRFLVLDDFLPVDTVITGLDIQR